MFASLLKRLTASEPEQLPETDARLALGALLVRVARTDGHYDADEVAQIDVVLAARYSLNAADTTALRQQCEQLESEAPDTIRFTRAIKDAVDLEHRIAIIECLWQVVLADGVRDASENASMRLIAGLLGVSDVESAMARKRVPT